MSTSDPVVLIVEDEADVAETYRLWLEDSYTVETAKNGDEGIEKLNESVSVVLLDRMMPGPSGDEVLEQIRKEEIDCRVAMVTAVEPDFDILEMGFDAYLSKPVRSHELDETVKNLLERSSYDTLLQEYYALVEKRATLEASKTTSELDTNEEYERLNDRLMELRRGLSETLGEIEDDEALITRLRNINKD